MTAKMSPKDDSATKIGSAKKPSKEILKNAAGIWILLIWVVWFLSFISVVIR